MRTKIAQIVTCYGLFTPRLKINWKTKFWTISYVTLIFALNRTLQNICRFSLEIVPLLHDAPLMLLLVPVMLPAGNETGVKPIIIIIIITLLRVSKKSSTSIDVTEYCKMCWVNNFCDVIVYTF